MPPTPPRHKSVTFCSHCKYDNNDKKDTSYNSSDFDVRYYSDPGRDEKRPKIKKKPKEQTKSDSTDSELRYYSEPDARNYFEIDYEFLKELRRIARNNCPKCRRKRSRKNDRVEAKERQAQAKSKDKSKPPRNARPKESYVYCNGRYHSDRQHCRRCCRVCSPSTVPAAPSAPCATYATYATYAPVSRSCSLPASKAPPAPAPAPTPTPRGTPRNGSLQSNKSVSFLDSGHDDSTKDEPNYTAKSFTNDLKQFLLKPSTPRLSLRDKFIISLKQEFEATKRSPKLKAIKGLWKSY